MSRGRKPAVSPVEKLVVSGGSELDDSLKIARAMMDSLESDVAAGRENPDACRAALINVIATLRARTLGVNGRFEPKRKAGNRDQGIRYDDDEMYIIASLPKHDGSMKKAAEVFWGNDVEDLDSRIRKLHRIAERIKKQGLDPVVVFQTLIDAD